MHAAGQFEGSPAPPEPFPPSVAAAAAETKLSSHLAAAAAVAAAGPKHRCTAPVQSCIVYCHAAGMALARDTKADCTLPPLRITMSFSLITLNSLVSSFLKSYTAGIRQCWYAPVGEGIVIS